MQQPPAIFLSFFRWYCHPRLLDHIEGDLIEVYRQRLKKVGKQKADLKFIIDVLLLFRPSIIKPVEGYKNLNNYGMIKSYFKIGWRNLLRNKGYSFINIGGLALGMAVAILIGLWMHDEISFNKYHNNYEQIAQVRIRSTDPNTGVIRGSEAVQFPMGASLKSDYPQYFKHILMAFWVTDHVLSLNDKKLLKTGEFIEAGAPDMLSLKMLRGTYTALSDPHSIILSKSTAESFFGNEDPINKSLKIDNRMDVSVTGVYEDLPQNARFGDVQFFSPWDLWVLSNDWIKKCENNWGNNSFNIYVQLQPNVSMETAAAGVKDFWFKYGPQEQKEDIKKYKPELLLYAMSQWHLYSEFKDGLPAGGRITFVWLFGIAGIFVLLLACINFMNLSTARSEKRAREVGVRKAIGSAKLQLVQQFMSESFLVVLLSFFFSLAMVSVSLSLFNELAEKKLELPFYQPIFWLISFAFILLTGLLSSLYPAFYLSSFQPVKVLKGALHLGRLASMPRKVLVVVQFTVSIVLIIGTMVVYRQIQYARDRPIGYNREGLISVPMNDPNYSGKYDVIKNELLNTGVVSEMALSSSPITSVWNNVGGFTWTGKDPELASDFSVTNVTYDFGSLTSWQMIMGRDFSRSFKSDSAAIIINETAAKYLGLKNPVGEFVKANDGKDSWQIIGVIKDLIMTSPYSPEKRAFFFLDFKLNAVSQIHIKIKPTASPREALPKIEAVFKKIVPSASFDYKFVDQEYAKKFGQEERIGKLASLFAVLAIFISCLGLFGLASFVAEQRTKEIGIRKVMGASVLNLWKMLSKDFVFLVNISVFISIPFAYYFMNNWLRTYEYRAEISWWIFAASGAGALMIALLTVSYQSVKAAKANPVNSLKSE
jgi:putative ABC transport system permease protein